MTGYDNYQYIKDELVWSIIMVSEVYSVSYLKYCLMKGIFSLNIIIKLCHYYEVTCSAIWGLLDKNDDLRASHELLNAERIL